MAKKISFAKMLDIDTGRVKQAAIGATLSFFVFTGSLLTAEPLVSELFGVDSLVVAAVADGGGRDAPATDAEFQDQLRQERAIQRQAERDRQSQGNPGGGQKPKNGDFEPSYDKKTGKVTGYWVYNSVTGRWECVGGYCSTRPPKTY